MEKVTVLLASGQEALRHSLQVVLEHEKWIKVVTTSGSKTDILALAEKLGPEIVIMDFDIAGDSLEIGHELLEKSPDSKIIVLNNYDYVGQVDVRTVPREQKSTVESVEWVSKQTSVEDLIKKLATVKKKKKDRKVH